MPPTDSFNAFLHYPIIGYKQINPIIRGQSAGVFTPRTVLQPVYRLLVTYTPPGSVHLYSWLFSGPRFNRKYDESTFSLWINHDGSFWGSRCGFKSCQAKAFLGDQTKLLRKRWALPLRNGSQHDFKHSGIDVCFFCLAGFINSPGNRRESRIPLTQGSAYIIWLQSYVPFCLFSFWPHDSYIPFSPVAQLQER